MNLDELKNDKMYDNPDLVRESAKLKLKDLHDYLGVIDSIMAWADSNITRNSSGGIELGEKEDDSFVIRYFSARNSKNAINKLIKYYTDMEKTGIFSENSNGFETLQPYYSELEKKASD